MAKGANQKLKLLYLMDYLKQNTNEEHPASVANIIEYLATCDIPCERKTVYDDIEQLRNYGMDIVLSKGKYGGYFCASHDFDLPEIKVLVDSVQSSKFITEKQSLGLIKKLSGLTNKYYGANLKKEVMVQNRVKTKRESVLINIDRISDAISKNKTITFKYFNYNVQKKPEYRHGGQIYEVSPFCLIWDDEYYYLLAFDDKVNKTKHFRVDKMDRIRTSDNDRKGHTEYAAIDRSSYNSKVFGMFGGAEEKVTLRFSNSLAGVVIDRFGKDVILIPDGPDHFKLTVDVLVSNQFFAWVFGFAENCEILSPERLRDEIVKIAKQVVNNYE